MAERLAPREGPVPAVHSRAPRSTAAPGRGGQALPRIRFILVPQTGHGPWAMRRPDSLTFTSPSKSRYSLHFTQ
ncbi:MAG: hypothetical protein JWP62_2478 [Blastococcus sp.]|nr:hypothetical protein [Blastococcus sp.]